MSFLLRFSVIGIKMLIVTSFHDIKVIFDILVATLYFIFENYFFDRVIRALSIVPGT